MHDELRNQVIEKARAFWDNDQPLQAGAQIFERIPIDRWHVWAYGILKLACSYFPKDAAIETVLEFAEHPEKWGYGREGRTHDAHRIVDTANRRNADPIIFQLATQVGKVVYTAQQYPAPFDHGAGWEIAAVLKQIVQSRNDTEFEKLAWAALANRDFINLEKPVASSGLSNLYNKWFDAFLSAIKELYASTVQSQRYIYHPGPWPRTLGPGCRRHCSGGDGAYRSRFSPQANHRWGGKDQHPWQGAPFDRPGVSQHRSTGNGSMEGP
ncbi:MAG: hypothetical protein ACOYYS_10750 [Chloroflexota bacterium]